MENLTARDVMNEQVMAVRVDMTVGELAAFLAERQITGAPVLDREGHLVGVVSLMDIAESGAAGFAVERDPGSADFYVRGWEDKMNPDEVRRLRIENEDLLVRDIMTPTVFTIGDDTPVARIARAMIAGRIHRLLVTRLGRVVGIVTSLDLLKLLCAEERPPLPRPRTARQGRARQVRPSSGTGRMR
jgi:predicted transcriptional regulator